MPEHRRQTKGSSRKSVESSQDSDEMELDSQSSQQFLYDSPWSEEDKSAIKYSSVSSRVDCVLEKLHDYEIKNLGRSPRNPRLKLPSSLENLPSKNMTESISKLTGEELNRFLKSKWLMRVIPQTTLRKTFQLFDWKMHLFFFDTLTKSRCRTEWPPKLFHLTHTPKTVS